MERDMSSLINNSESVHKALSSSFAARIGTSGVKGADGKEIIDHKKPSKGGADIGMLPEDYIRLWNAEQEKTQRFSENREAVAGSKALKARYISNLENKIESLQAEAADYRLELELWKCDYQKVLNEKTLLEVRLYFQKQMLERIRMRRAAATANGVSSMWPQQDQLLNSAQAAPSATEGGSSSSHNSGDVSLQEASSSSNRPSKRAKHAPVFSANNQG